MPERVGASKFHRLLITKLYMANYILTTATGQLQYSAEAQNITSMDTQRQQKHVWVLVAAGQAIQLRYELL